jgi:hypothetical protein
MNGTDKEEKNWWKTVGTCGPKTGFEGQLIIII